MTKEFQLTKEQFLNGENFDPWYGRIKSALENRNLKKYIEYDAISKIKLIDDKKKIKKIIKKNSKAKSIIINNITDQVYDNIRI